MRNRTSVATTATPTKPPITAPAIVAPDVPDWLAPELEEDDGADELEVAVELDPALEAEVEAEGGLDTEVGTLPVRQVASSERPTVFTWELPPWRPLESVMRKTTDVPEAMSAIQSKEVGPTGAFNMKESPAGMRPYRFSAHLHAECAKKTYNYSDRLYGACIVTEGVRPAGP